MVCGLRLSLVTLIEQGAFVDEAVAILGAGQQPSTTPKEKDMDKRQTIGFAGAAALAIGVFVPLVSMPIVGSLTYFNNGKGDGVLVLALAVNSALIILAKKYRALWLTGLASLGLMGYTFLHITQAFAAMERKLATNPFRGLANAQMQWGWALLVIGAMLLLAAAASKDTATPQPAGT
jgi:hypothetical protein